MLPRPLFLLRDAFALLKRPLQEGKKAALDSPLEANGSPSPAPFARRRQESLSQLQRPKEGRLEHGKDRGCARLSCSWGQGWRVTQDPCNPCEAILYINSLFRCK